MAQLRDRETLLLLDFFPNAPDANKTYVAVENMNIHAHSLLLGPTESKMVTRPFEWKFGV